MMTQTMERRSHWSFAFADKTWKWFMTRPDGSVVVSRVGFTSPQACAEDAVRNGYVAWPTLQERRKAQPLQATR